MEDPTLHPDPIKDYIREMVKKRLQEMGANVDPAYVEEATNIYNKPGSPLRIQYMKAQADKAAVEARDAQLGAGSFGDVAKRTILDAASGAAKGITSPGRFALHALGMGDKADNLEQTIDFMSGQNQMGGRGLSSNPILGSIQSAVEPAADMGANAQMIGNAAFEGAGNMLSASARALPESGILRALSRTAQPGGSAIGRMAQAAPRAMAKGVIGSTLAMPDETLVHGNPAENLAYAGLMGGTEAIGAGRVPGAVADATATAGPGVVGRLGRVKSAIDQFTEGRTPDVAASPDAPASVDIPVVQPEVPSSVSPRQAKGTPKVAKPMTGGDGVNWDAIAPEDKAKVAAAWQGSTTLQARAKMLGVEGEVMGAGGKKLDPRIIKNISEAKDPSELFGYLQRRVVKAAGVVTPTARTTVQDASGSHYQDMVPAARPEPGESLADYTPVALRGAEATATPAAPLFEGAQPDLSGVGTMQTKQGAEQAALTPRKGTIKRKDVLSTAARTSDGSIDWDALTTDQQSALTRQGMFGKGYAGKLAGKKMSQIQGMLSNGQFESFYKALKRPAPVAAVQGAEAAPAAAVETAGQASSVVDLPEIQSSPVSPRKGKLVAPVDAGAPVANAVPAEAAIPAPTQASPPTEASTALSANGWDALNRGKKAKHIADIIGDDIQAVKLSALPYDQLPAPLRARLQGDPALATDLTAARGAEGGAPLEGASFRRKPKRKSE